VFGSLGVPELLVLLLPLTFWIAMMGAIVWGLITLNRIRQAQQSLATTLKTIEEEIRRQRTG
jgi:hypothetical protein